jgi:hypothetical protein
VPERGAPRQEGHGFFRQRGKSMRFQLINAAKEDFPLCKVLDVSPRGYFAWRSRLASSRQREDLVLLAHTRVLRTLARHLWQASHDLRTVAGRRLQRRPTPGGPAEA